MINKQGEFKAHVWESDGIQHITIEATAEVIAKLDPNACATYRVIGTRIGVNPAIILMNEQQFDAWHKSGAPLPDEEDLQ